MSAPLILYIEDNISNRELVKRVLEIEGFEIMEAVDGRQGLEVLQNRTPDLILMDINLPGLDGYQVTSQIRLLPRLKKTPIIALTANIMRGERQKSLDAGCDGYIPKPIDIDKLPKQLLDFLGSTL